MIRHAMIAAATVSMLTAAVGRSADFSLTSPEIKPGGMIAKPQVYGGMGCGGGNISPSLEWKGAPAGTKSFALTVYDPDAPTGSGWWHWVVYNIPANVTSLPAGAGDAKAPKLPAGAVQANTDFGSPGYGGPCPPPGKPHHYIFTVYALSTDKLEIPSGATPAFVGFNISAHVLGKATFTGLYGR